MKLGIEEVLVNSKLKKHLKNQRVALVGHPASVTRDLTHSLDALIQAGVKISAAFGPQHGMKGDKQDNMIETYDEIDPQYKIPVFSLYGEVRRPTKKMMESFDLILVDLQDVGCRIYTYITTLFYIMDECARFGKECWVLDRPNPAGRPIEGTRLKSEWESFVGAASLCMRHGLTLGELALWYREEKKLNLELKVVPMKGYKINKTPGFGWPTGHLSWVNPSPNMPTLCTARCFPGTVMLEGTNLSEGRGTTRPLQIFGAPFIRSHELLAELQRIGPKLSKGCRLRACFFEPTFHKFKGELCEGLQIHVDDDHYNHEKFRPYRLMLGIFKAIRNLYPRDFMWRQPPYEYENERLAIDLLNGGDDLRKWVDDSEADLEDLEKLMRPQEQSWERATKKLLLY